MKKLKSLILVGVQFSQFLWYNSKSLFSICQYYLPLEKGLVLEKKTKMWKIQDNKEDYKIFIRKSAQGTLKSQICFKN